MFQEIICVGRLGADPEYKIVGKNDTQVTNFSMAATHKYSDKEETEWFQVVVFGKSAEACAKYLRKGSLALVKGRMQTTMYEKDGKKNYITKLIAETWRNLTPRERDTSEEAGGVNNHQPSASANMDDIPFMRHE